MVCNKVQFIIFSSLMFTTCNAAQIPEAGVSSQPAAVRALPLVASSAASVQAGQEKAANRFKKIVRQDWESQYTSEEASLDSACVSSWNKFVEQFQKIYGKEISYKWLSFKKQSGSILTTYKKKTFSVKVDASDPENVVVEVSENTRKKGDKAEKSKPSKSNVQDERQKKESVRSCLMRGETPPPADLPKPLDQKVTSKDA